MDSGTELQVAADAGRYHLFASPLCPFSHACIAVRAAAGLCDALGASATLRTHGLDRYWRNARTISSHNPRVYRERQVGAFAVNGTPPPTGTGSGSNPRSAESTPAKPNSSSVSVVWRRRPARSPRTSTCIASSG